MTKTPWLRRVLGLDTRRRQRQHMSKRQLRRHLTSTTQLIEKESAA